MRRTVLLGLAASVAVSAFAAVAAQARSDATTLVVYSGRDERFIQPLFDRFTAATGIKLQVRYGDSATLAATLLEEGRRSPADAFIAQDAGALGAVAMKGRLLELPSSVLNRVGKRFRAPGKRWVGLTGRARVVAYNTQVVRKAVLPKRIWGYTQSRWNGKVGLPPTNASFQAFVSAMRLRAGDDRTRDWLLALKANDVKFYPNNSSVLAAIAAREIEVGFVNHYYLYQLKEQQPSAPVANHFLEGPDPGALINVSGGGIVTTTKKRAAAQRLLEFLLSTEAQRFFARSPGRAEYPLARPALRRPGLPKLESIEGAGIDLGLLGRELPNTLELLSEVGYTR